MSAASTARALSPALTLGPAAVRLEDVWRVAVREMPVALDPAARPVMEASCELLDRCIREGRFVYGVTSGFGALAGQAIAAGEVRELQRNLLYHLASGVGEPLSREAVRALMTARAASLARGHSALPPQTLELLLAWLNQGLTPVIPSMGTVGASGDLTPLAHLTLALCGEGEVEWQGQTLPAAAALHAAGLPPLASRGREALAFVNGTSVMTGIAALNGVWAEQAVQWAIRLTVLCAEVLGGRAEAYHPLLGAVRPHPGQVGVIERLQQAMAGGTRLQATGTGELPQDPYTLRCAPQLLGAIAESLAWHRQVVETELNSVTDNPVFFPAEDLVLHGGNFQGQHVSFASDALANAVIQLAVLAERQVARVCDPKLNGGLPAFLQPHRPGLHSGFMGAQVTASALVAEMRTLALPASVQSIPTNNNNQDVVSMGTIAARKAARLIDLLYRVLAIEAMVLAQAYDLLGGHGFGGSSNKLVGVVRTRSPFVREDRALSQEIEAVAALLRFAGQEG